MNKYESPLNAPSIDTMPFSMLLCDKQGLVIHATPNFEQEFEEHSVELIGKFIHEQLAYEKETSIEAFDSFDAVISKYNQRQMLFRQSNFELTPITVTLNYALEDQNLYWLMIEKSTRSQVLINTTLHKLKRLNQAVQGANIGIWDLNLKNESTYFSLTLKELIGIDKDTKLTWQQFKELVNVEDSDILDAFITNHIDFNIPLELEFRINVNGLQRWFKLRGEAFPSKEAPTNLMGSLIDCTLEKSTLLALNNAIESKNLAMEAGKIGTWRAEVDAERQWHWDWDELCNRMFELSPEDTGNLAKWAERLHPEDASMVLEAVENSLRTGEFFEQRYRSILPNGELKYFLGQGKVGQNRWGENYRIDGICIDQTEIYRAQNQLQQLNSELEERVDLRTHELNYAKEAAERASQTKSDFLSMMSHELRTPMNAVIGSLDLLSISKQSPESMDLIDTAKTSANNLVHILNDILDINKIEAGKMELDVSSFPLSEVIDNVIKIFIPVAEKKDIILNIEEDPAIPRTVVGDPVRVRQILFNLLGNAIKFTSTTDEKEGSVKLKASVSSSSSQSLTIKFSIIDNGIGISAEVQSRLFTPFTQAEKSTTRKFGGTGLGLAICGKLTDMMNGHIELQSMPGKGSTFSVEIPLKRCKQANCLESRQLVNKCVGVLCLDPNLEALVARMDKYLFSEGAKLSNLKPSDILSYEAALDAIFILVGKVEDKLEDVIDIYTQLSDSSSVYIAVERADMEYARVFLSGARVIATKPISRNQFINSILHVTQDKDELSLDEFGLLEESEEIQVQVGDASKLTKKGILIVEDNPLNQKLIFKQMKTLGFECDLAEDGCEGLKQWKAEDYNLILTDCHMPNIDGYEMTEHIRHLEKQQDLPRIPIIAVTGAAMTGDSEHCLSVGMDDFVSKPVQLADLKKVLEKWYHYD